MEIVLITPFPMPGCWDASPVVGDDRQVHLVHEGMEFIEAGGRHDFSVGYQHECTGRAAN
jgi:hypothetical protein